MRSIGSLRGVIARTRAHALPPFVISLTARHPWGAVGWLDVQMGSRGATSAPALKRTGEHNPWGRGARSLPRIGGDPGRPDQKDACGPSAPGREGRCRVKRRPSSSKRRQRDFSPPTGAELDRVACECAGIRLLTEFLSPEGALASGLDETPLDPTS
jgi:hypothetical protein